jgi:hypothetical protein
LRQGRMIFSSLSCTKFLLDIVEDLMCNDE